MSMSTSCRGIKRELTASLHKACQVAPQVNGNFLVQIELMPPPKAEALAHLDGGSPAPKRYARVTVIRGGHNDCMDYQVGWGPVSTAACSRQ
jgi:Copper amine oxidase, N2 domain